MIYMSDELNAFEVIQIAIQIEKNGTRFYTTAAGLVDDPKARGLLEQLAQWERKHIQIFSDMGDRLSRQEGQSGPFEPYRGEVSEARMMAGLAVFGIQPDPRPHLTGKVTRRDILSFALKQEKDSVTFYTGLTDFVPVLEDREIIDRVLQEEIHHVRLLTEALGSLAQDREHRGRSSRKS